MPASNWGPYKELFDAGCSACHLSDATWNGLNVKPPKVHFEEHSILGTVDGDGGSVAISLSLPAKPFLEAAETQYQHTIVTARPLIDPKPQTGTFHLPNIPQLNRFYGREAALSSYVTRAEPDGLGVVVKLHDSSLQLRGIPVPRLLAEIFKLAEVTAKQSTAGKIAFRLIQHMGGLDSCRVFRIRGVRDLLHAYAGLPGCASTWSTTEEGGGQLSCHPDQGLEGEKRVAASPPKLPPPEAK